MLKLSHGWLELFEIVDRLSLIGPTMLGVGQGSMFSGEVKERLRSDHSDVAMCDE